MSRFGDVDPARCSMGQKRSLERVVFSLKSPFLRGVERYVLCLQCHSKSDCTLIAVWNGSYGSMGPGGHIRCLNLVIGTLPGAQWVQNDRLRGSFLA